MCSFLNVDVAEKLGATAVMVVVVKDFSDVLNAKVEAVTLKA